MSRVPEVEAVAQAEAPGAVAQVEAPGAEPAEAPVVAEPAESLGPGRTAVPVRR